MVVSELRSCCKSDELACRALVSARCIEEPAVLRRQNPATVSRGGAICNACNCALQVLFSSVAALLGSPGQAGYSAANGALDALAAAWRCGGVPATSLQWGAWSGSGMAAQTAGTEARLRELGLGLIEPAQGLRALDAVLHCGHWCALRETLDASDS